MSCDVVHSRCEQERGKIAKIGRATFETKGSTYLGRRTGKAIEKAIEKAGESPRLRP